MMRPMAAPDKLNKGTGNLLKKKQEEEISVLSGMGTEIEAEHPS